MSNIENKNPPDAELKRLLSLYDTRDFTGAEGLCRELITTYPDSATVLNFLGVVFEAQGKSEEALLAYESAIQKNTNNLDVYHNAGILLNKLGRPKEAINKFREVVELDPEDVDARNNIGVILQKLNQHEEALTHLSKAVTLSPGNASVFFNYANSLKAIGKDDEALEIYNQAVRLDPAFSVAFNNRGNLLESMKRYEDARRSYTRAIELDRSYVSAYSNRGVVEKKLGNYPGAAKDFTKATELDPWQPENPSQDRNFKFRLYVNLGDIQMYFGEHSRALDSYNTAAEIEPESSDVLAFKGNALAALGNLSEGLLLRQKSFGFICFDVSEGVSIIHG